MLRKFVLAVTAAFAFLVALSLAPPISVPGPVAVTISMSTPALAYEDPCPGSSEAGLVGWKGRTSLNQWGQQPCRGQSVGNGYRAGAAYYHGGGREMHTRVKEHVRAYVWHRHYEVRTHRVEWNEVDKVGEGRSIAPSDSRCWMLPNGYRRCPNQ